MPHAKISGFVTDVEDDTWWARLFIEDKPYEVEMSEPLPDGMGPGNLFTIHLTKRGKTYLYWITKPSLTRSDLKRARFRARELRKVLFSLE